MAQSKAVSHEQIRRLALALPEVQESSHQDTPDFRVRGKIFATLPPSEHTAVLKTVPADLDLWVQNDPATFRDVWNGRWLGVDLTQIDADLFNKLLVDAWCYAAPKTLVRAYQAANA